MPGWLIALFVTLLFLVVVAALLLLFRWTASAGDEQRSVQRPATPATFPHKPVATFRRKQPATFRRRQGKETARTFSGKRSPPDVISNNGGNVEARTIKVNLDAICRVTGRSIRMCKCTKCDEERPRSGA